MKALTIVKGLDKIKNGQPGLDSGGKGVSADQFVFEGAPEGFHGRVVVAVAFAAHGGLDGVFVKSLTKGVAGVLDATIAVEQEVCLRVSLCQGHVPTGQNQFGVDVGTHGPADDVAAVEVHPPER